VLAWIDCEFDTVHEAGDHLIVIGRVRDLDVGYQQGLAPLLFFRGGYAQVGLTDLIQSP
jgi:flavin reductase (DIM6/NTAB) family NADH-FMN oxidoreductase RutF